MSPCYFRFWYPLLFVHNKKKVIVSYSHLSGCKTWEYLVYKNWFLCSVWPTIGASHGPVNLTYKINPRTLKDLGLFWPFIDHSSQMATWFPIFSSGLHSMVMLSFFSDIFMLFWHCLALSANSYIISTVSTCHQIL